MSWLDKTISAGVEELLRTTPVTDPKIARGIVVEMRKQESAELAKLLKKELAKRPPARDWISPYDKIPKQTKAIAKWTWKSLKICDQYDWINGEPPIVEEEYPAYPRRTPPKKKPKTTVPKKLIDKNAQAICGYIQATAKTKRAKLIKDTGKMLVNRHSS